MQYLSIAIGGALGSMARFFIVQMVISKNLPYAYATLIVNAIGSFLIGVLFVLIVEKYQWPEATRLFLIVGFLGAFTTFSTFSLDNWQLLAQGEIIKAGMNILLNVWSGLLLVWLAIISTRYLLQ